MEFNAGATLRNSQDRWRGTRMKTFLKPLSVLFLFISFTNCSHTPPVQTPEKARPPGVSFGHEIEVFNKPFSQYVWSIDKTGNAHFIIEPSDSNKLHYVIIGKTGVLEKSSTDKTEKTPSYKKPKRDYMDCAFDSEGNLHLISNGEHFIYKEESWRQLPDLPCRVFGKGYKDLICADVVEGQEVGSPGRLDWYVIAGYGGGLIWPWYSHPDKLVIVKKSHETSFKPLVVDAETKQDVLGYSLAADEKGNIYVSYLRGRGYPRKSYIYIKKDLSEIPANDSGKDSAKKGIVEVFGESLHAGQSVVPDWVSGAERIAVDPETGMAMLSAQSPKKLYLIRESQFKRPIDLELSDDAVISPAAAGKDQFHVLINHRYYLLCGEHGCSAPMLLSENTAFDVFSDGYGNAVLMSLSKEGRLSAKWITITE